LYHKKPIQLLVLSMLPGSQQLLQYLHTHQLHNAMGAGKIHLLHNDFNQFLGMINDTKGAINF